MRLLPLDKRFVRLGLLALVAAASCWICSTRAETKARVIRPAERPPMFVLQVGIGKYVNGPVWAELRGAVTDVVEMRKVLEGERYGIPAENIVTLADEQGTKAQIFEKFRTHLIANAQKHYEKVKDRHQGAVVLFQFSGHGSQVPDADGDEKDDGKDETLVTHDSQDKPGKNFDITDDEIYALTSELRRWTDNIVYIFDSCHSGSGTRDSQDVRRLPERTNPVVSVGGVGVTTRSGETKKQDDGNSGVLPPGDDYIVITAARPNELASQKNCFEECGNSKTPVVYGNLTFYLIDELKNARSDTSYRELMENVTRRVTSEKPTQTPQLEGDRSRFVFGALGRKEDNFVRIVEAGPKKPNGSQTVKIRAGAMQGITPDTIVFVYDKAVTRFDQAEKIASGSVTAVTPAESTVTLWNQKREITVADKSAVVSSGLDSLRPKVNLDADVAKLTPPQKSLMALLRKSLSPAGGQEQNVADVVNPQAAAAGRWDFAVLKDKYSTVAGKIGGSVECEAPGGSRSNTTGDVFYIAGKDFVPLFRFCLAADFADESEQTAAAARLEQVVVHLARLRAVSAIANTRSGLNGKLVVKPVKLSGPFRCDNGRFHAASQEDLKPDSVSGMYEIASGSVIWFEITNNSPRDLYMALLNLPPDGSVKLFSPRQMYDDAEKGVLVAKNGGKRILMSDDCRTDQDGDISETGAMILSGSGVMDRFKFIAATEMIRRSDLAYLEMPGLRRGETSTLAAKSDWTTVETIFQITDTGK